MLNNVKMENENMEFNVNDFLNSIRDCIVKKIKEKYEIFKTTRCDEEWYIHTYINNSRLINIIIKLECYSKNKILLMIKYMFLPPTLKKTHDSTFNYLESTFNTDSLIKGFVNLNLYDLKISKNVDDLALSIFDDLKDLSKKEDEIFKSVEKAIKVKEIN